MKNTKELPTHATCNFVAAPCFSADAMHKRAGLQARGLNGEDPVFGQAGVGRRAKLKPATLCTDVRAGRRWMIGTSNAAVTASSSSNSPPCARLLFIAQLAQLRLDRKMEALESELICHANLGSGSAEWGWKLGEGLSQIP